jgi:hypothetical protein
MRRKASKDSDAARRGELAAETLAERRQCYETVVNNWFHPQTQSGRESQKKYA